MHNFKRVTSLIVAVLVLSGSLLSGCGGGKDESTTSSGSSSGTAQSSDAQSSTLQPYELDCYFLAPQGKDLQLVQDEANKILKEKINATIKLNYFWWDNYQDKQKLLVASGQKIDTMFSPSWWGFSTYAAQKAWLPLDDLLAKYGKDIVANINPSYLKAPVLDGKLYAIPTSKDMFGVGGVLVNKEMADKYKFDFSNIKTPADFEPMLKTIKEKEPGIIPFLSIKGDHSSYFVQDFYEKIGTTEVPIGYKKTDSSDIKIVDINAQPEVVNILKLTRDWYKKGYINQDVATLQDGMPYKKNKKAFMWGEQLKPGKADEMKAQLGYELIQVNAYNGIDHYVGTGDLTNSMLVISRNSKDPARAMMFINLLFSDKKLKNLLDWGIEGKHYKKIGDNQIDFADGVTPETSGYTGLAQWAMGGSQFLDYLWANEKTDKWQKMQEFNNSAKAMKTLGWIFNVEPVKTEMAALTNVGKVSGEALGDGIVDYDTYYPKMKSSLEKAGSQKVIDEAQKQVDTYLKK
jgi:putative aldouronate transport system substrate-binding protein